MILRQAKARAESALADVANASSASPQQKREALEELKEQIQGMIDSIPD